MESLDCTFVEEFRRWGDKVLGVFTAAGVGQFRGLGQDPEEAFECTGEYRLFGQWGDSRHGRQFRFEEFVPLHGHTEAGVLIYLQRAPNVGISVARKLLKVYGADAVRMLRDEPQTVSEVAQMKSFTRERAQLASNYLQATKQDEDSLFELIGMFAGKGFPRKLARACAEQWGANAAENIRRNPYELLRFPGVGFKRADELYLSLGLDPTAILRQATCAWWRCKSDPDGHTWIKDRDVVHALKEGIAGAEVDPVAAVSEALRSGKLHKRVSDDGSVVWLADSFKSEDEAEVAMRAAGLIHYGGGQWPDALDLDVSVHQGQRLECALGHRLAILGGSPGTGKTYTAARLIAKIQEMAGADSVRVVAPTGKAAVRISEALEEYGIGLRATTIHTALEVEGTGDGFVFSRDMENPLDEKYIVVDESSMIDLRLMRDLLRALRMDSHLLLVGDVNQLPPVGAGAPLRDLIEAGAPYGELTEIRRNSGRIVQTCAAIRDRVAWSVPRTLDVEQGENLMLVQAKPEKSMETILELLDRLPDRGIDPVWDTQVLCAVNDKGPLARRDLNEAIRNRVNNGARSNGKYWVGDKVVCLRNSFLPLSEDLDFERPEDLEVPYRQEKDGSIRIYVANGELGRVLEEDEKWTRVVFPSPERRVLVPRSDKGEQPLDLGFALSVHKSQGSEWEVVIVGLDESGGARMVCDRGWIYTAVSRAKRACILVGDERTAHSMAERTKIKMRQTFLAPRYTAALAELRGRSDAVHGATATAHADASETASE